MPPKSYNILVRMPNWLGDCVMAMPALRHLSETLPRASIYLAGRENFRGLFLAQPGVAGFVPAPASGFGKLVKAMSDTRRIVRDGGVGDAAVDLGLLLTNSISTAAWMWRCRAKVRIGYNRDGRRLFLTHPVPCGGVESAWHFVRYYLWLAKVAEGVAEESEGVASRQVQPLADYMTPTIAVAEAARQAAVGMLRSTGIDGAYAVIAPASAYGAVKDWPPAHYRALVGMINRMGLPVVVTGASGQAATCQAIADGQRAAVNLAGKTTMDQFAGLLAEAALFVGGDSGGAHVAGALGIPTVVIFGITNPSRTRAGGPRVVALGKGEDKDVKLSTPEAREAAMRALAAITPDMVMAAIAKLLAAPQETDACTLS